ncbi:methyltransferase domain-containing protein [Nocardiopsis sp. NPDC060348]|uniref:methyltransferase domain-containing protein n=1 Tax=unclassified Nocardiopsis TaxID=2649073 RepID=UPI001160F80D
MDGFVPGEDTGLPSHSCDIVTMASSFHWVDFDAGLKEFHRILRPGGWFVALGVTRLIEVTRCSYASRTDSSA